MGRAAAATAPARTTDPARRHATPRRTTSPARPPARRDPAHRRTATRTARPAGARVLDALLTGRAWIALVGLLLAGIVFFNVDLLQMNREITQMADRAAAVKRENDRLRHDYARLASSERIQEAAATLGLVLPAPGEVRYLDSNPKLDADKASKRIIAPDPAYVAPEPAMPEVPTTTTPPSTTATTPPATTTGVAE
jgi:cell division protein FtsL